MRLAPVRVFSRKHPPNYIINKKGYVNFLNMIRM